MIKIAGLTNEEREELFLNTANRIGMPPAIVEKDFWVCYMLDYLFQRSQWKDHLVFKGGTSLSKAYHLIQRFSEDIDLILIVVLQMGTTIVHHSLCSRRVSPRIPNTIDKGAYRCCRKNVLGEGHDPPL